MLKMILALVSKRSSFSVHIRFNLYEYNEITVQLTANYSE